MTPWSIADDILEFSVPGRGVPFVRTTAAQVNVLRGWGGRERMAGTPLLRYLEYKESVGHIAANAIQHQGWRYADKGEAVAVVVQISLARPSARQADIANIYKSIEDAMTGVAYHDDIQVEYQATRLLAGDADSVHVRVYRIPRAVGSRRAGRPRRVPGKGPRGP